MIYNLKSTTRYVYHYTTASTAKAILKNRTLKMGRFAETNDPRESQHWTFTHAYSQSQPSEDFVDLSQHISEGLKASARLSCFCTDTPPLSGDHTADIFNRGFAKPRMWAQYAGKHRGACLVFDRDELIRDVRRYFKAAKVFSGLVFYENEGFLSKGLQQQFVVDVDEYNRLGHSLYIQKHLKRHLRSLFYRKLLDWRDESEWRIISHSDDASDCFVPITNALIGVIHGAAMSRYDTARLIRASDEPGIDHMALTWDNGGPWYPLGGPYWRYEDRKTLRRLRANRKANAYSFSV